MKPIRTLAGVIYMADEVHARVAALEKQVQQLQLALAFWLPHVPDEGNERAERISKDTFLLIGYEGPMEADAEELGWIKLSELMET